MQYNKKLASVWDAMRYYLKAFFYMSKMINRDKKIIDEKFVERTMLAVTQVNGCKVCSQVHAQIALDIGLSKAEISKMLSDDENSVPESEAVGVIFATNYADKNGRPDKAALNQLYETYGRRNGKAIIASCTIMMIGNTMGIAWDTFSKKFKGVKTGSSIFRELGIFFSFILMIPINILAIFLGLIFNF
ncbi:MAG: carboxymuconolactone decarboxylase family protein [Bacilli bacterium]